VADVEVAGIFYWSNNRWFVETLQALTKRTSDSGRTLSAQPTSTSASSAFEALMSSSAKHQLAVTATSDKQKDGSASVAASTAVSKELDTASRVSEQLVKQVEVNCLPNCLLFVLILPAAAFMSLIQMRNHFLCCFQPFIF